MRRNTRHRNAPAYLKDYLRETRENISSFEDYSSSSSGEDSDFDNTDSDSNSGEEYTTLPTPSVEMQKRHTGSKGIIYEWIENGDSKLLKKRIFTGEKKSGFYLGSIVNKYIEIDFFFEYLSEEFWGNVVRWTNAECNDPTFELTLPKLYKFLNILIMHGLLKLKCISLVWKKNSIYYNEKIASILNKSEFHKILKYIIVTSNYSEENEDKLSFVRDMEVEFKNNCITKYISSRNQSLDEISFGYYGRTSNIRRTRFKKDGSSFQAIAICDASSAALLNFEFVFDNIASEENDNALNKTQNCVLRILEPYYGKWYWVIMDNYYISPNLFQLLGEKKFCVFGTWKTSMGMPDILKQKKVSGKKLQEAREKPPIIVVCNSRTVKGVQEDIIPIMGISFYCNAVVKFLTSIPFDFKEKQKGGKKSILRFCIQHRYNLLMNGVDVFDFLCGYFSTYIRSQKWWKRIFFWLFDAALTNSYIAHQSVFESLLRRTYLESIAFQLLQKAEELEKMDEQEDSNLAETVVLPKSSWNLTKRNQHWQERNDMNHLKYKLDSRIKCVLCRRLNNHKKTNLYCQQCLKPLCPEHWIVWHTVEDVFEYLEGFILSTH